MREKFSERINSDYVLLEDTIFSSPSTAASFVVCGSANSLTMWKMEDGKTLKDIESQS
ncbi:DUF4357 domain-containing protein [Tindallia californiensis]|uniref:DUF4357 domain-containing protein n=1 Tax=Tindallia californiensis TaxID=159292 RepID=UPI001FA7C455